MDEYIAVGKGYRLTRLSRYCRRYCISIDSFPLHTVRAAVFACPSGEGYGHRHCRQLMDGLHNLLRMTMTTYGCKTPHTIYGGRQWRSMDTQCTIYCGGQCRSIDSSIASLLPHVQWRTRSAQSLAVDNACPSTAVSPVYCHTYNTTCTNENQSNTVYIGRQQFHLYININTYQYCLVYLYIPGTEGTPT